MSTPPAISAGCACDGHQCAERAVTRMQARLCGSGVIHSLSTVTWETRSRGVEEASHLEKGSVLWWKGSTFLRHRVGHAEKKCMRIRLKLLCENCAPDQGRNWSMYVTRETGFPVRKPCNFEPGIGRTARKSEGNQQAHWRRAITDIYIDTRSRTSTVH